ncbi:gluconolactonase [Terrimonas sp.]|uniref:SMP-30/gluconolactonase/LRE family protein n=1 Tax=Terrimonas sp. TaxID=1914338 RepID=UPI000D51700F|nr:SMP-30/gluconolactonase/LRE family protein [Terrimonas sp.]PVD51471.1 gluconolactonase [Terrimonas sp.]
MARYTNTVLKLMFALLFLVQKVHAQQTLDSLIDPTAGLIKISDQFSFTEGPAVNKQGDIYFTDQPNDKIWKYDINGNLSLFMDKTGRSNGLFFDKKGNIISCADENNELWSISPDKKVKVLLSSFEGKKLNGPNDLWIDAKGGIYFTDPYYQRDYWTRKKPEMNGKKLYYLPAGKKIPIMVDDQFVQPNGIVGTPDGRYLYVADIGDSKIYKYNIKKDGTLSERNLFAPEGSDGMTLDTKGNLYITGKGVTVYDASGFRIGNIPVPSNWVGNICFGGKNRKFLFITASESVYSMQMKVAGIE